MFEILATAKARKASDLHLSAGSPPLIRVNGELMQMMEFPVPTPEEVKSMFMQITTTEGMEKYQREHELGLQIYLAGWHQFTLQCGPGARATEPVDLYFGPGDIDNR
jgi:twitching motility protein PilT